MSQKVWTKVGLVDDSLLTVEDVVIELDNVRKIVTTWTLKQDFVGSEGYAMAGEMVRQDAAGSILRGPSSESSQGVIG
jgi:hypothetical protein